MTTVNRPIEHPNPQEMRQAMRHLATGVVIVTVATSGARRGMTANSLSSVTLAPPLLSICLDLRSTTYRMIAEAGHFAISILGEDHQAISAAFAKRQADGFDPFGIGTWRTGALGDPQLVGALTSMDMRLESMHTWADHAMLIASVMEVHQSEGPQRPLIFFGGGYTSIVPSETEPS